MDLPIFKKQEEKVEHYWTLVIGRNWVDSGIWQVTNQKTKVVARGGTAAYQEGDISSIVEAADGSLSNAATALSEDIGELSKVVFGLSPVFLDNGEIKKEYIEVLKKLSKELELNPAGFVVIPEAIIHLLKSQEGLTNAILVGVTEENLEISLVQSGKSVGTVEVGRSMSIGSDIAEGLARMPQGVPYPTRILLYDHKVADLEEAQQSLLNVDWEKQGITFLHTPKVDILADGAIVSAVSLAGGAEVAGATSLEGELVVSNRAAQSAEEQSVKIAPMLAEELSSEEVEEILEEEEGSSPSAEHANVTTVRPEELGFSEGNQPPARATQSTYMPPPPQPMPSPLRVPGAKFGPSGLSLPELRVPRLAFSGGGPIIGVALGLVLLVLTGFAYWYLPSAKVSVFVSPKSFNQNLTFAVDPSGGNLDVSGKKIPGRYVEIEKTINREKDTTGSVEVGDKATGQITVSTVGPAVTLTRGTVLSAGTLKFTLDKDIKVASGSGPSDPGRNIDPASVTAAGIGTDYNVVASTIFKIGKSQTTDAKNEKAFSGGTSREVSAVSASDLQDLLTQAQTELKSQAKEAIVSQISSDEIVTADGADAAISKKDYSAKTGEEAKTVSLDITGRLKYVVINRSDLVKLVEAQGQIPEGFTLSPDKLTIDAKAGSGAGTYEANVQTTLLPKVDPQKLIGEIAGKSPQKAHDVLSETPGFIKAEVSTKYKFPLIGTLPHIKRKISIEVVAEQ
ncbi:MAG: hypothetical protein HY376_01585 [Candidatus Blackburnbacteria bacterium]|nr:hypothetical protein [Candidatus Blackburnbacteria bacterium]